MSISAYKKTILETEDPRALERRIISQITARLVDAAAFYDNSDNKIEALNQEVRSVVWDNQQLWLTLKIDLMNKDNPIEDQTKAHLINLSGFIDKQSARIFSGSGKISLLIEINQSIIAGLSGRK
jgi:flagellar protein FlaF